MLITFFATGVSDSSGFVGNNFVLTFRLCIIVISGACSSLPVHVGTCTSTNVMSIQ